MYRLKDRWTTRDGVWEANGELYSIDQVHLDRWKDEPIEGRGCATCIFVKLEGGPEDTVHFETNGGYIEEHPVDATRWAHATMYNPGSGYNATRAKGPWTVRAQENSEIVDDIGLPNGWHVAHFVVLEWEEDEPAPGPDPVPEPTPDADTIQVAVKIGEAIYQGVLKKTPPPA